MAQPATPLPTELLTIKSLKTLSGASITVWIVCLVLSSLFPENLLQYWHYRMIAFVLSVLITFTIIRPKDAGQKLAYWLLILGNTCYIFINASGINSISKNQLFDKPAITINTTDSSKKKMAFYRPGNNLIYAGLFSFGREADWWPDKSLVRENTLLREELVIVKNSGGDGKLFEKDSLLQRISVLEEQNNQLKSGKTGNEKTLIDQNTNLAVQVKTLTAVVQKEKDKNALLLNKKPDNTAFIKQINDLKAQLQNLTSSLTTCNQKYNDCMAKNAQLTKDCAGKNDNTALLKQINNLNTDITNLKNSLTACNQKYQDCINSKADNGLAEKYKSCVTNYKIQGNALQAARDSLKNCGKQQPIMKKPAVSPKIN